MLMRTRVLVGVLATVALAGGAIGAAAAQAGAAAPRQLTLDVQPVALQFFGSTGPITGFPTSPLAPGDRIIGRDRVLQAGVPVGHDNEVCTVSFDRDVLCQDIVILGGQGDVQASWSLRWPDAGTAARPAMTASSTAAPEHSATPTALFTPRR